VPSGARNLEVRSSDRTCVSKTDAPTPRPVVLLIHVSSPLIEARLRAESRGATAVSCRCRSNTVHLVASLASFTRCSVFSVRSSAAVIGDQEKYTERAAVAYAMTNGSSASDSTRARGHTAHEAKGKADTRS